MLALFIGLFCTVQRTTYLKNEWCLLKNNTLFIRQLVSKVAFGKAKPFLLDYVFINYPRFTDSVHVQTMGLMMTSSSPPSSSLWIRPPRNIWHSLLSAMRCWMNNFYISIGYSWEDIGRFLFIAYHQAHIGDHSMSLTNSLDHKVS